MKGKRLYIAEPLAIEIEKVAGALDISTTSASKIVFFKWNRRPKNKSLWKKSFNDVHRGVRHKELVDKLTDSF